MDVKEYLNFELKILSRADGYRAQVLNSPKGQAFIDFKLPFAPAELTNSLSLVGGAIRHLSAVPSISTRASANGHAPLDPKRLGTQLYDAVFSGEVGSILARSLDDARQQNKGLRIQLRLTDVPELACLPWEYLYDTQRKCFLSHSLETPIVRYLELAEGEQPLTVPLPLHILVVIADPEDVEPRLKVQDEWAKLQATFKDLQKRKLVKLEKLEVATVSNLQARLRQNPPVHILHFIGHGKFDQDRESGGLLLEDEAGLGAFVPAERLAVLLRDHRPRLVFLNTCEGASAGLSDAFAGTAQHLVELDVPAVIAMQFEVQDTTAITVAQVFYQALVAGFPVDAALAEARKMIYTQGSVMEWGTPVLFMRAPNGYLFDVKAWLPRPDCPYPGMRPFTEKEQDRFFGREDEIREAVGRLRLHPFLAVIGASGTGKSSLVFAGISPALRRSRRFPKGRWAVKSMRPGETPYDRLAALLPIASAGLNGALPYLKSEKLLLIIDQFEEIFTASNKTQALAFQQALLQLIEQPGLYIILTTRADFYPDLRASLLWPALQAHRLELQPLDAHGLRQAISEPAHQVGVEIEPALVERLLADAAGEPGALPLIQETLVLLWEAVARRSLTLAAYTTLTKPDDHRTGLQIALAQWADAALTKLSLDGQAIARRFFLRLVQFGEGRADTRRQQPAAALGAAGDDAVLLEQTLRHLVDSRLLMLDGDEEVEERKIDIAHEALLTGWPAFQSWLKEYRTAERRRRWLESKTVDWVSTERKGRLLDEVECQEAERWLVSADAKALGCSQALEQLVQASQAAIAEAKRKARENATKLWRRTAIAAVALLVTGVLVVVTGWAAIQAQNSQLEKAKTEARQQANVALQQLAVDPLTSLDRSRDVLLNKPYVPEAEFALTQALRRSLEDGYRSASDSVLARKQIALGAEWIAVGKDQLNVVAYDSLNKLALTGHTEQVREVRWSTDGKTLLSRDDRHLFIWRDQARLADQPFDGPLACAELRPNDAHVAVCDDRTLRLWSYTDKTLANLHVFKEAVENAVWSSDGRWLAAWDVANQTTGQTILIWDIQTGQIHATIPLAHAERIRRGVWSPDARFLVGVGRLPLLQRWCVDRCDGDRPIQLDAVIDGVEFIEGENLLTWGTADLTRIWSAAGEQIRQLGVVDDRVQGVVFSPDKAQILTLLSNGSAQLWTLETGKRAAIFCCHAKAMWTAAWRDDRTLATSGKDGTARIWDIATGKELMTLRGHTGRNETGPANVYGVRWQADHNHLLTYGEDGSLRRWRVFAKDETPQCAGVLDDGFPICYVFSRVVATPTAELNTVAAVKGAFLTIDRQRVARRLALDGTTQMLNASSPASTGSLWSLDGRYVFTYTTGLDGYVLDAMTSARVATVTGPITKAFWLDPQLLISRGAQGALLVAADNGARWSSLPGITTTITAARQHASGQLALALEDGTLQLWAIAPEQAQRTAVLVAPSPDLLRINALEWSLDGRYLLATSSRARLWDTQSSQLVWSSREEDAPVHGALSPDGRFVALTTAADFWVVDMQNPQAPWHNQAHTQPLSGIQWLTGARWPDDQVRSQPWGEGFNRLLKRQPWHLEPMRPLLFTWSGDGTARLWDWEERTEILRVAEPWPLTAAAVSADGTFILTAAYAPTGNMGVVRLWESWHQAPATLRSLADRQLSLIKVDESVPIMSEPLKVDSKQ